MPGLFLVLALMGSGGFSTDMGGAVTPCADIARLERIAIHSHEARNAYGERHFRLEMGDIEELTSGLSADSLVPGTSSSFLKHRDRLADFIAGNREAVRLYKAGNKQAAIRMLQKSNTRSAWRARSVLTDFWGCRQETGETQYQEWRDKRHQTTLEADKQPRVKKRPRMIPAWKVTLLKARAMANDAKEGMMNQVSKALPEEMRGEGKEWIILSTAGLMLIGMFFCWRIIKAGERSNRQPCRISARLIAKGGNYDVKIVDLGRGGAKLMGGPQLDPKTPMQLKIGKRVLKGKSAWANRQYSGIAFQRKLRPEILSAILKQDQSTGTDLMTGKKSGSQALAT